MLNLQFCHIHVIQQVKHPSYPKKIRCYSFLCWQHNFNIRWHRRIVVIPLHESSICLWLTVTNDPGFISSHVSSASPLSPYHSAASYRLTRIGQISPDRRLDTLEFYNTGIGVCYNLPAQWFFVDIFPSTSQIFMPTVYCWPRKSLHHILDTFRCKCWLI